MLEPTDRPFVLRVDESDPAAWQSVVREISAPSTPEGVVAEVDVIDADECLGLNEENIGSILGDYRHPIVFLADALTMTRPGHPVLVIDRRADGEPSFRALPRTVQFIESRIASGEVDFAEMGEAADDEDDGVFRGLGAQRPS